MGVGNERYPAGLRPGTVIHAGEFYPFKDINLCTQLLAAVLHRGAEREMASTRTACLVCERASDSMCPRFFGIFRSSCFVSIRYSPRRRWQTNQVEAKLALKAASIES